MKRVILFVLICFVAKTTNAQIWCTPSSEWYFTNYAAFGSIGFKKWTYLYDTIIAGKNCNKIRDNTVYDSWWPPTHNDYTSYFFTHVNNRVLFIKDYYTPSNNFDTLVNFNAAIGNKWRLPPVSTTANVTSFITVTDTGRSIIQGLSLKWIKISASCSGGMGGGSVIDTIFERLGALKSFPYWAMNICPWQTDSQQGGPLRCFSDNQINGYVHTWTNTCNYYYNGVVENTLDKTSFTIHPNPANEFLTITSKMQGNRTISILTILGEIILKENYSGGTSSEINISTLKSGIYFVRYSEEGKRSSVLKFVKE